MSFTDNAQLFGFDHTGGIVAVEFREPSSVDVYARQKDGSTSVLSETFAPSLWNTESGIPLAGDLAMSHLLELPDWFSYQDARGELQKRAVPSFSFNDPVQQYLTSTGRTLFKNMVFEDLRRMQIDAEVGEAGGIVSISLCDTSGWEESLIAEDGNVEAERAAITKLTEIVQERDPDIIEGHNLFKEMLPAIATRAKKLKVKLAWGRDGSPATSRSSRLQIAEKTIQYPKFVVRGRHLVDTWLLAQYYDVSSRELESFKLADVASHFEIEEKESVFQRVHGTRALSAILSRSYFIQAQIFPYNYQDVIIRGNATKIDALFLREYLRQKHSIPDFPEPRPYEGGYTDIFETGIIQNVWHCDIASLYPSVMLSFGFLPDNDQLGVFAGMLRDLRTFRLEAKNELRSASDPQERGRLDALQTTFKILINSFYGYLGFAQGHFADFNAAENVTAKGRELLRQMVDWLNEHGARVIEIDTDGIYFHPPEGADVGELQKGLASELPAGIEVEFDKRYLAMFSYKAKNYALLGEDGHLTLKGAALKSRGMEPYLRNYLEQFIRHLLEGNTEAAASLRTHVEARIRSREIPVTELAKTEALQDSPASYAKKIGASSRNKSAAFELALKSGRIYQAGDQISYYITGTKKKVVAYEAARFVSEWNAEERDENVEYYVGKLDELAKKFAEFGAASSAQRDLF